MKYIIKSPDHFNCKALLPASKSISNRALIIKALADSKGQGEMPQNLATCDDTDVMVNALQKMPEIIDIKAAGTAMRFLTAYLCVSDGTHTITGTTRMKERPIGILVDALRALGAKIEYTEDEGFPPLRITGTELQGGELEVAGNISSQYISALLMIAPKMKEGLKLRLTGSIVSRPYIDMTISMMRDFGANVAWTSADTISVAPAPYSDRQYFVENDWTAASYWYEIMTLANEEDGKILMEGLMDNSMQGDTTVKYIYSVLGIHTHFDEKKGPTNVTLTKSDNILPRFDYDFTHQPDLAQTLIATCLAMGKHFNFRGLASLKIKETDRIEAMKTEMRKLGFVIYDYNDSELRWDGERCEPADDAAIDTYHDHRMAMAIAPMCISLGEITINNPEVVTKSYPQYWDALRMAGFGITEIES